MSISARPTPRPAPVWQQVSDRLCITADRISQVYYDFHTGVGTTHVASSLLSTIILGIFLLKGRASRCWLHCLLLISTLQQAVRPTPQDMSVQRLKCTLLPSSQYSEPNWEKKHHILRGETPLDLPCSYFLNQSPDPITRSGVSSHHLLDPDRKLLA